MYKQKQNIKTFSVDRFDDSATSGIATTKSRTFLSRIPTTRPDIITSDSLSTMSDESEINTITQIPILFHLKYPRYYTTLTIKKVILFKGNERQKNVSTFF